MSRLLEDYKSRVVGEMKKKFNIDNTMAVPRLLKICINMGLGKALENNKLLDDAARDLTALAGQKSVITLAKKSVANFKLREGMKIGCRVTIRRKQMYEFLDRLISVAIPRIKDFRGVSRRAFDGRGNYTIGLNEQTLFPEVDVDKTENVLGMDITFVISGNSDEQSLEMLRLLGMPFREN